MKRLHGSKKVNGRTETLLKEIMTKMAEASYQVALTLGFRGTYMSFLSDLQDALREVIRKDRSAGRPAQRRETREKITRH
jgi:hypothetical protein